MSTESVLLSGEMNTFTRAHQESTEAGVELGRRFADMAKAIERLDKLGIHQKVVFPDELTQKAWVAYQEMQGDFVQERPDDPPIPGRNELAFAPAIAIVKPGQ